MLFTMRRSRTLVEGKLGHFNSWIGVPAVPREDPWMFRRIQIIQKRIIQIREIALDERMRMLGRASGSRAEEAEIE